MKRLNTKTIFLSTLFSFLFSFLFLIVSVTPSHAQTYPIKELGNCSSQKSCFSYCEQPENIPTCWSYGKYILHKQVLGEQTTSQEEFKKKYQLVFPITELGNCNSVAECKTYCDNKDHQTECIAFAKKKGFYKELPKLSKEQSASESARQETLIQAAKQELGCTSMDECRALCQNPDNKEKCEAFSKNHGLSKPPVSQQNINELVQKAKIELGCTSQDSCRVFCEQNKEKCASFSQKNNPENNNQDKPNADKVDPSRKIENTSEFPSNCKDSEECRIRYCQKYPGRCPGFPLNGEPSPSEHPRKQINERQYKTQSLETTSYPKPTRSASPAVFKTQEINPTYYQQQSQTSSLYPSSTSGN